MQIITALSLSADNSGYSRNFPADQLNQDEYRTGLESYPVTPQSCSSWNMQHDAETDATQQQASVYQKLKVLIPYSSGSLPASAEGPLSPGALTAGTCSGPSTPGSTSKAREFSMIAAPAHHQPARLLKVKLPSPAGSADEQQHTLCPSARRLLDCDCCCSTDVSKWLDQQISMRESARTAHIVSCNADGCVVQYQQHSSGVCAEAMIRPDLPPPAFQLLGLL